MTAAPTQGFTRRIITSVALLSAAMLVLAVMPAAYAFPAVTEGDPEEEGVAVPMDGTPFWPCGTPAVRQAIALVNDTAPLDLGRCVEDENGAWSFVPGEDTQDLIPEDVPDPGDDIPDPGDDIPDPGDDIPDPGEVPGLDGLPAHLNCGGYEDVENWTLQLLDDADCNGHSNERELHAGCDPLDPQSHPSNPDRCNPPPVPTPDPNDPDGFPGHVEEWADGQPGALERWIIYYIPSALNCAGYEDLESMVFRLMDDADCNGHSNENELNERCNPLNFFSSPTFPSTCMPEPDPDDPEQWASETSGWVESQATFWLLPVLLGTLPPWLAGVLAWLLEQVPETPDPPEPPE